MVVATGISTIGHETEHFLETSQYLTSLGDIGNLTEYTEHMHRFVDEINTTKSDHFRAWLTQRLVVALGTAAGAAEGRVHPTPSKSCGFCPVRNSCNVRMESDF